MHYPSSIRYYNAKTAGAIEHYLGRKVMLGAAFFPDTAVFFTWQIEAVVRMRTTFFCCIFYSTWSMNPNLG